jgi:hypothetical protein
VSEEERCPDSWVEFVKARNQSITEFIRSCGILGPFSHGYWFLYQFDGVAAVVSPASRLERVKAAVISDAEQPSTYRGATLKCSMVFEGLQERRLKYILSEIRVAYHPAAVAIHGFPIGFHQQLYRAPRISAVECLYDTLLQLDFDAADDLNHWLGAPGIIMDCVPDLAMVSQTSRKSSLTRGVGASALVAKCTT